MMDFNRSEIVEIIRKGLCEEYVGGKSGDKEIIDFEVELTEEEYRYYGGGGYYDSLVIYAVLKTKKRGIKSRRRIYYE